jgi:magnesium chelatase family protein
MPQFARSTLQSLRQPMEDGRIRIVRAAGALSFPARVMLVAAANPCPCGYFGDASRNCRCLPGQIEAYQNRIGGPIMDRFDMTVTVARPNLEQFFAHGSEVSSAELAGQVQAARRFAADRALPPNRLLDRQTLTQAELLRPQALSLLKQAAERLQLSGRALVRVLRLARTIADLDTAKRTDTHHISEALSFRGEMSYDN